MFLFFIPHAILLRYIATSLFRHFPKPLHPSGLPQHALFSLLFRVPALFSLPPILPHTSTLSVCRNLPVLAVMILSARLVSCQAPRIHSGLLLMLTLMFLYFTRKEEKKGCVLALLSTNTPREAVSQQTRFDDCVHFYIFQSGTWVKHTQAPFIDNGLLM